MTCDGDAGSSKNTARQRRVALLFAAFAIYISFETFLSTGTPRVVDALILALYVVGFVWALVDHFLRLRVERRDGGAGLT